ncbi:hypothetical protein ATCC90586_009938 [Pythium insidiosum]|nr:hypothetical protein ATCC90586_009938 [Pythium insidiosum]
MATTSSPSDAAETPSLLQQLTLRADETFRDCSHRHRQQHARADGDGDVDGDGGIGQRGETGEALVGSSSCSSAASASASSARRVLTKNAEPKHNDGLDNADRNLIVRVRDVLGGPDALPSQPEWVVLDLLGQGTFGQVFRCQHAETKEIVAVKVIRNHPSYYKQALVEVQITNLLNRSYSDDEAPHIVRLMDTFEFRHHLCLVFELLSLNVYELIAENNFNGFPLDVTRGFLQQILHAMIQMEDTGVIHCDLKPENILLVGQDRFLKDVRYADEASASALDSDGATAAQTPFVKVVDFGSACLENETVYSYIQSRFYRSPEVLLGIPYTGAIDVWSLGCIAVEMFLGLPLFPGVSEHDQLRLIEETLGRLPQDLLRRGRHVLKFFNVRDGCEVRAPCVVQSRACLGPSSTDAFSIARWITQLVLKTPAEFARENDADVQVSKKYFKHSRLRDMVHAYPYSRDSSAAQREAERQQRDAFLDLVLQLLQPDPEQRCTARDALLHPFVAGRRDARQLSSVSSASSAAASPRPSAVAPFPPSHLRPLGCAGRDYAAGYAPAPLAPAIWPYSFGPVREGSHAWGYPGGSAAQLSPSLFFPVDRARDVAPLLPMPAFPLAHQTAPVATYAVYPPPVASSFYRQAPCSKVAPVALTEPRAAAVVPMADAIGASEMDGCWGSGPSWRWQEDRYGCHGWPYPSQAVPEPPAKRNQARQSGPPPPEPQPTHPNASARRAHHRQPAPTQAPREHAHGAKKCRGKTDPKAACAGRPKEGSSKKHRSDERQRPRADAPSDRDQTVCAVEESKRSAIGLESTSSAVSLPT